MQDLWPAHYQIFLITLLEQFMKLNVKMKSMIKKCKTDGIKYKDCDRFLQYSNFKDDLIEYKGLCSNKNYHKKFDENLKKAIF